MGSEYSEPETATDAIVVTPEMIEAGEVHLYGFHRDRGVEAEETVKRIYRAMYLARPVS